MPRCIAVFRFRSPTRIETKGIWMSKVSVCLCLSVSLRPGLQSRGPRPHRKILFFHRFRFFGALKFLLNYFAFSGDLERSRPVVVERILLYCFFSLLIYHSIDYHYFLIRFFILFFVFNFVSSFFTFLIHSSIVIEKKL